MTLLLHQIGESIVSAMPAVVSRLCGGFRAGGGILIVTAAAAFVVGVDFAGDPARIVMFATATAYAADKPTLSAAQQSLIGARQWLNTAPPQAPDLHGKVVLVNFWTYSCINSLRALPYVRAWADKYKDRGLVTVGDHAPEFGFEKDIANVRQATRLYDVRYPVAPDNNFTIWNAFDNEAWPAFYLVGADGRVRQRMLGEGDYDTIELTIQRLLAEANGSSVTGDITNVVGEGVQAPPDLDDLLSPETYVGYAKAENFASPGGLIAGAAKTYSAPSSLRLNHWGLVGAWNVAGEFATLNAASGGIRFRFHARDLHFVLGPSVPGQPLRFRVKLDDTAPGADHGVDVDAEGTGSVQEPRLYQLIRQTGPVLDRTFEIEFLDPGVRAYVFTFG
jgi:thiol-disulfide isomerase/thioredoxin